MLELRNVSFTGHFAQFWLGWSLNLHLWSWIIWFWNLINYIILFLFILSLFFLLCCWFILWKVIDNNSDLIDFFLILFIQGCIIGLSLLFLWLGWNFRFHGTSGLGNSWWYFGDCYFRIDLKWFVEHPLRLFYSFFRHWNKSTRSGCFE